MTSIALITEGITDQVILDFILTAVYEALEDEISVNVIQPLRDATDESRQGNFGGWEKVLEFCSNANFDEILSYNDLVVIQLDTDVHSHRNFLAKIFDGSELLPIPTIIENVTNWIKSLIPGDIFNRHSDKIVFAIAIHSSECWLTPLYANRDNAKFKIIGCENTLALSLPRHAGSYKKNFVFYEKICRPIKSKAVVDEIMKYNKSLEFFVNSLPGISV